MIGAGTAEPSARQGRFAEREKGVREKGVIPLFPVTPFLARTQVRTASCGKRRSTSFGNSDLRRAVLRSILTITQP
jgi:hypothetical protein